MRIRIIPRLDSLGVLSKPEPFAGRLKGVMTE